MINMQAKQEPVPLIYSTFIFQVLILVMLFVSLLYGQQALVILSLLLLIMFSITRLWCRYSQGGLECRLQSSPAKVFPGETIKLQADMINHRFLPVWVEINVVIDRLLNREDEVTPGEERRFNNSDSNSTPNPGHDEVSPVIYTKTLLTDESGLLWKQVARFDWELNPVKRGIYCTGPVRLVTGDIFGFYRRESEQPFNETITVYPRLVTLNPFSAPLHELFGTPGSKSPVVDPVYPVSTRNYQENRPARHIHWKASARHDRLQEKVFEPSIQQKILLVIDVGGFREDTEQLFEQVLEAAASLAVNFETRGKTFGLASNGALVTGDSETYASVIAPGMGSHQLYYLLDVLARLKKEASLLPLSTLLQEAGLSRGLTALCFSYFQNPIDEEVKNLFNRFKIPVISVLAGGSNFNGPAHYSLDQLIGEKEVATR